MALELRGNQFLFLTIVVEKARIDTFHVAGNDTIKFHRDSIGTGKEFPGSVQTHFVVTILVVNALDGYVLVAFFIHFGNVGGGDGQTFLMKCQPLGRASGFFAGNSNGARKCHVIRIDAQFELISVGLKPFK